MADTKITGLTETTTLDAADALVAVDVSDTTMAASGTNKYITKENLLTAVGAQEMLITQELDRISDPVSGEFDFNNIPQGYDHLIIQGEIRGDSATLPDYFRVFVNDDTTEANYHGEFFGSRSGSIVDFEAAAAYFSDGNYASSPTGANLHVDAMVRNYSDNTSLKDVKNEYWAYYQNDNILQGRNIAVSSITDPVTRLRIRTDGHPTDTLAGELILYGVRTGAVVPENPNVETLMVDKDLGEAVPNASGEFDITLPTGYDSFAFEGYIGCDITGSTTENLYCYLNDDTTIANYHRNQAGAWNNSNTPWEAANSTIAEITTNNASSASTYASVRIQIRDLNVTTERKVSSEVFYDRAADEVGVATFHVVNTNITGDITRFRLVSATGANLTGKLRVTGRKVATVGAVTYPGDAGTAGRFLQKVSRKVVTNGEFDWDNIPQHADSDLVIKGWIKSDYTASTVQEVYGIFNTDTTAGNYHAQRGGYAANGVSVGDEVSAPRVGRCVTSHASTPANAYTEIEIRIPNYTGANRKNILSKIHTYRNNDEIEAGHEFVTSEITNAITRFRVRTNNHSTNTLTGELALYIERDLVLTPGKHELETIELTAAGTFDFDNIPSGFKRLWVQGYIRVTGATADDSIYCHINGDTTDANYQYDFTREAAGGAGAGFQGALPLVWHAPGTTSISADGYATVQLVFEGYDNNTSLQNCRGESHFWSTTNYAFKGFSFMTHQTATSPITRLHFVTDNDPTDEFAAGSKLTLYGEH